MSSLQSFIVRPCLENGQTSTERPVRLLETRLRWAENRAVGIAIPVLLGFNFVNGVFQIIVALLK